MDFGFDLDSIFVPLALFVWRKIQPRTTTAYQRVKVALTSKAQEVAVKHSPRQWAIILPMMGFFLGLSVYAFALDYMGHEPPVWATVPVSLAILTCIAVQAGRAVRAGYRRVRR